MWNLLKLLRAFCRFALAWCREAAAMLPWAALASLLIGLVELALVPGKENLSLPGSAEFVCLSAGISALVTMPASIVLSGLGAWVSALEQNVSRPRTIAAAALGLASLPYAVWLARFTFSGPRAAHLPLQPALVVLSAIGIMAAFTICLPVFLYKTDRALPRIALGAALLAVAGGSLFLNRQVLPGQYEPLHTLLSIATGVSLLLSLLQFRPRSVRSEPRLSRRGLAAFVLLIAAPLAATARMPSAPKVGALIAQSSTTPRYLVLDLMDRGSAREVDPRLLALVKPEIDAPRALDSRRARAERRPNIVLFFVDNLSASHTGFLGYKGHPTTPNIDIIAKGGAVFSQAYSSLPHTRLFMSSVLMGRYSPFSAPIKTPKSFVRNSIGRLLGDHGYHLLAQTWFEDSGQSKFKPRSWGIDTYIRPPTSQEEARTDEWPVVPVPVILAQVERHLDEAKRSGAPVFLWMHMINAHGVHKGEGFFRPDPRFDFGPSTVDQYDGALASADQWLPSVRSLLESKLTDPENTYYIFGSDHGCWATRFETRTGKTAWQASVHVPLAIAGPQIRPARYDYTVDAALDVAATVLDLAGIDPPEDYDGISLVPLATGEWKPTGPRPVVLGVSKSWQGVVFGAKKVVMNKGTSSLFDLSADPGEKNDIAQTQSDLVERLSALAKYVIKQRTKLRRGSKSGLKKRK